MRRLLDHPVPIGWLATVTIFGVAAWAGFSEYCVEGVCTNKFAVLSNSRPNEIGDTLAGFASALAFVWIIVTVWLQSKELAAQREELRLTREEMEEQRMATQEIASSGKAQAQAAQDTLRALFEDRARKVLDEKLKVLKRFMLAEGEPEWLIHAVDCEGAKFEEILMFPRKAELAPDEYLNLAASSLNAGLRSLRDAQARGLLIEASSNKRFYECVDEALEELELLKESLSPDQLIRLSSLNIWALRGQLKQLAELDVWNHEPVRSNE